MTFCADALANQLNTSTSASIVHAYACMTHIQSVVTEDTLHDPRMSILWASITVSLLKYCNDPEFVRACCRTVSKILATDDDSTPVHTEEAMDTWGAALFVETLVTQPVVPENVAIVYDTVCLIFASFSNMRISDTVYYAWSGECAKEQKYTESVTHLLRAGSVLARGLSNHTAYNAISALISLGKNNEYSQVQLVLESTTRTAIIDWYSSTPDAVDHAIVDLIASYMLDSLHAYTSCQPTYSSPRDE